VILSRWLYYLASAPTLLLGVKNGLRVARALLARQARVPFIIELRNGLRFRVRTAMDVWIIKETCLDRQYERASVPIADGWTVIDIGAALGDFAIDVARRHPGCKVAAYEPFPESFALLQENLALNRVENVATYPYAISGGEGELRLSLVTAEAVQHSTAREGVAPRGDVRVSSLTLDRAFADLGLSRCDYLKSDCEGAEYDIFFNASAGTLSRIRHICLEYHDGVTAYSHHDLAQFFEGRGFRVRRTPNPAHRHLGLLHAVNLNLPGEPD
jgi:FkbM family methyltransferase